MSEHTLSLLTEFCDADGVAGFEDESRAVLVKHLAPLGDVAFDRLGSVICLKAGSAERPRVMLDAHIDELGFIVQRVTDAGFIKFLPVGSWSPGVLPAQRVRIDVGGEKIEGVIGSTPPHFLPADRLKKAPDVADLFIDIGARDRAEAESWGVRPGSWGAATTRTRVLRNCERVMAKAFDDRVGCAVMVETLERIDDHPNTLIACGSVQEEVGGRGARTAPDMIDPDFAIVLEGSPADDALGLPRDAAQGMLGGGAQIRAFDPSMIAQQKVVQFAIDTARDNNIPYQIAVRAGGGTDGGLIHTHGAGVPSIVLGVPVRYAHSHAGVIDLADYRAVLDLVLALVERLDEKTVRELLPGAGL